MSQNEEGVAAEVPSSFLSDFYAEILSSPLNLILLAICGYLALKLFVKAKPEVDLPPPKPQLPPLKKQDMTYQQLKYYDGRNEEGRVCVGLCGKVFDVTKGKQFYGPGGPYETFAGRDATRCLGTFNLEVARDEYDDLSDLTSSEMDSAREWESQFQERYHYVGRLLKPGEEPTDYSDDEGSQEQNAAEPK